MTDWSQNSAWLASQQRAATSPDQYGFNPTAGVRVEDGVQQTGLYGKTQPAPVAAPKVSGGSSAPSAPKEPPVVERKDWTDYATDDMDMSKVMGKYTSEDSPLMIAAETAAKRRQGSMGLLNTQGTISSIFNDQWNAALPVATADVDRATGIGLAQMGDDLQRDITSANITAANEQVMAKIWGDLVNTELATMGAGINSGTWTQTGQTNMENVINSAGGAFSGFLGVPLS